VFNIRNVTYAVYIDCSGELHSRDFTSHAELVFSSRAKIFYFDTEVHEMKPEESRPDRDYSCIKEHAAKNGIIRIRIVSNGMDDSYADPNGAIAVEWIIV
jgi:hypothetical protein